MSKLFIIALITASLARALHAHAGGDESNRPENTVASPCVTNADGRPGKNNQGPGAGRGGKGGTIVLKGKRPARCRSAHRGRRRQRKPRPRCRRRRRRWNDQILKTGPPTGREQRGPRSKA